MTGKKITFITEFRNDITILIQFVFKFIDKQTAVIN